jgi:SNF2 family DNA or RNA helicase
VNPYLIKIAKAEPKKKKSNSPHHDEVLGLLEKGEGVLAQHSMGSGKTLLALRAAARAQKQHPNKDVVISAPASVIKQFPDEAKKFGIKLDPKRTKYYSHEELVNRAKDISKNKNSLLIIDEAHRLRNRDTAKNKAHALVRDSSDKALILSGTAMYNKPHDIAALVNLAAGYKKLPDTEAEFKKEFVATDHVEPGSFASFFGATAGETERLTNKSRLKKLIGDTVHNYDAQKEMPEEFAKTTEKIHNVEMSKDQYKFYRFAENNIPWPIRMKIRAGLPLSKKENASLNAFSSGVRQIANSYASYTTKPEQVEASPKFQAMIKDQDALRKSLGKKYRGVVYSNYLGSGLAHLSRELEAKKISHGVYTGELSKAEKKRMVDEFNDGKFDTLLLSSSGAEGINLKGVRHMQVMEPHWNDSKIRQVVARAVRRGSHAHLQENDRHVQVDKYHSSLPRGFFGKPAGKSIDEYLHAMSQDKEHIKKDINKLIDANSK